MTRLLTLLFYTALLGGCGPTPRSEAVDGGGSDSVTDVLLPLDGRSTHDVPDARLPDCGEGMVAAEGRVLTTLGPVQGVSTDETVAFKGIRYAKSPAEEERFRAPQSPSCQDELQMADTYGAICPQLAGDGVVGDEDCLFLNVWSPSTEAMEPLPVLFFLHGGFNVRGASSQETGGVEVYNGAALAQLGAVVVTANYRLGALGFLAHSSLDTEDARSGNYAVQDQILALRWVQDNIENFGGDPNRVLLFGQSAGSVDSCALLASPAAAGLFSSAMLLSGACYANPPGDAQELGRLAIGQLGCDAALDKRACLAALPAADFVQVLSGSGIASTLSYPTPDDRILPDLPLSMINAGTHNHVPTVVSTTRDEMITLVPGILERPIASEEEMESRMRASFTPAGLSALRRFGLLGEGDVDVEAVLAAYPSSAFPSFSGAYLEMLNDMFYFCPSRRIARALHRTQPELTRRALFNHRFDGARLGLARAAHGFDLLFGFRNLEGFFGHVPTDDERSLSAQMSASWIRLAASGDPSSDALRWPVFGEEESYLEWTPEPTVSQDFRQTECDLWDSFL